MAQIIKDFIVKNGLIVNQNSTVKNDLTVLNDAKVSTSLIFNSQLDSLTSPTQSAGLTVNRGSSTNASFTWDETNDYWTTGVDPNDASQLALLEAKIDGGTF